MTFITISEELNYQFVFTSYHFLKLYMHYLCIPHQLFWLNCR